MALANPTTVQYNSYLFPVESKTTTSSRFIYDAAGRTVVSTTATITVKAHILAGATQDTTLDTIRATLERPGGALIVTGLGFGTLTVNGAGHRDLNFGPKPQVLVWENTGAGRAAKVTWICEVSLIGCVGAPDRGQVMEATHEVTFATDVGGYLTRTITATLRIPMTRQGVNNFRLPDTADNYFERNCPPASPGYARAITRTLDASKTVLKYTVTDTQLPGNPIPVGCVGATAGHSLTSQGKYVTVAWTGTLTAAYELEAGRPRSQAWDFFLDLAEDRLKAEKARGGQVSIMPASVTLAEPEVYGRQSAAFTMVYGLVYGDPKSPLQIFPTVGLWRPVPGGNWNQWSASLAQGARHPRGLSGVRHRSREDAIIDLCLNQVVALPEPPDFAVVRNGPKDTPWAKLKGKLGIPDKPEPTTTWLGYECQLVVEETTRLVVHSPLPDGPMTNVLRTPRSDGTFPQRDPGFRLARQESPKPITQNRGSAGYYVRLVGRALRFAYEVPRPDLLKVGGRQVLDANDPGLGTYWTSGLAGWTTHPIYFAEWNLRYFVPRDDGAASADVPVPPHPFQLGPLAAST